MKKQFLLVAMFAIASVFSCNLYAQLPKSYNFQPKGEPIYVVDGVVTSKAYLQKIDKDNIEFMSVLKGEQATKKYGDKAVNGAIEITTKKDNASNNEVRITSPIKAQPIFIVDGKEFSKSDLAKIDLDTIESMSVFKGEEAINRFGAKGKNGIVEIITKKENSNIRLHSEGRVFDPICYIDGKEIKYSELKNIDPDTIGKMQVLKGDEATKKYGDKGKNGIIEITIKK